MTHERRLANYDQNTKHHFGTNFDLSSMIGCQISLTRYRTIRNSQRPVSSMSKPRNLRHILRLHDFRFSPSNFEVLRWWRVTSVLVTYVATNKTHLLPNSFHDRFSFYNANMRINNIVSKPKAECILQ